MSWYTLNQDAIELFVLVVPRSSRSRVVGVHDGCLRIQLAAPPADGEANAALVALLADLLGVKKKNVEIVAGHGSRKKRLRVEGVSEDRVRALVG